MEHLNSAIVPVRRSRPAYGCALLVVIAAGLLWRSDLLPWPSFLAKYGGDALWALAVFLGMGIVFPRGSTVRMALAAAGIAWCVEFLQLYHAPWIDSVRATRLGRLALGSSFNGPDLIAYLVGVGLGAFGEYIGLTGLRRRS